MSNQPNEIIEDIIIKMNFSYKNPQENIWLVEDDELGLDNIFINYHDGVINIRISICDIPQKNREQFFRMLLELNTNIIYGGYGIVGNKIVLSHSILFENITFDKFAYIYNAFTLYIIEDLKKIAKELQK